MELGTAIQLGTVIALFEAMIHGSDPVIGSCQCLVSFSGSTSGVKVIRGPKALLLSSLSAPSIAPGKGVMQKLLLVPSSIVISSEVQNGSLTDHVPESPEVVSMSRQATLEFVAIIQDDENGELPDGAVTSIWF